MKKSIEVAYQERYQSAINHLPWTRNRLTEEQLLNHAMNPDLTINQVIAKAIVDAEEENGNASHLRADTKYFLMLNYSNMIYYPLNRLEYEDYKLRQNIYNEIKDLLSMCFKEAQLERREISSHFLTEMGLRNWDRLKLLSGGSW